MRTIAKRAPMRRVSPALRRQEGRQYTTGWLEKRAAVTLAKAAPEISQQGPQPDSGDAQAAGIVAATAAPVAGSALAAFLATSSATVIPQIAADLIKRLAHVLTEGGRHGIGAGGFAAMMNAAIADLVAGFTPAGQQAARRQLQVLKPVQLLRLESQLTSAVAADLDEVLTDQSHAQLIANTEVQRAVGAATQATYVAQGVAAWQSADAADAKVCPVCIANAQAGPIVIGQPFPSGELRTPFHANCRCAMFPVDYFSVPPYVGVQ
jgi:SPP1 gp7 family putative phage head morphogenesis protein